LFLVQAALPLLRRGSSVTYLTSRGGRIVVPKYAAVGVAKALAESLMRYLAAELAPSGVRINAVAPAIVETDAVRTLFGAEAAGHGGSEFWTSGGAIDDGPETYGACQNLTRPVAAPSGSSHIQPYAPGNRGLTPPLGLAAFASRCLDVPRV
jgi:NAD(P)-dependent dehydrogenase (short-subunit alcohol dehydrogenase family)